MERRLFDDQVFLKYTMYGVCFIGERPGRVKTQSIEPTSNNHNPYRAFHGNRSGSLIETLAMRLSVTTVLTNVVQSQSVSYESNLRERKRDTEKDFLDFQERMIELHKRYNIRVYVLLGDYVAKKFVKYCKKDLLNSHLYYLFQVVHPSFIVRFNKPKLPYLKTITNEIYHGLNMI
jgi:uracil-DNA glycosylase